VALFLGRNWIVIECVTDITSVCHSNSVHDV